MVVNVQDTGIGIPPEEISLLFTMFGKLKRSASMNSEGIGLGLRICKEIVHQNGGAIYVESEGTGKGSCFTFSMKMLEQNAS